MKRKYYKTYKSAWVGGYRQRARRLGLRFVRVKPPRGGWFWVK